MSRVRRAIVLLSMIAGMSSAAFAADLTVGPDAARGAINSRPRAASESLAAGPLRGGVVAAVPISFTRGSTGEFDVSAATVAGSPPREAAAHALKTQTEPGVLGELLAGQQQLFNSMTRNLLRYSVIQIEGNYRLHDDQILRAAGLNEAPWLWQISADEIRSRLMHSPWIETVSTEMRPYPAQLTVRVTEAEPWMIAEYERHSWLVSRKGVLLQTLDTLQDPELILETTELPRLDGLEPQAMVESYLSSANARFMYSTKLIRLLQSAGELPFPVERYTLLQNGSIKLVPQQGATGTAEVLLSVQSFEEAASSLDRLNRVAADLSRRGEHVRRVDLRFKNQAIIE